MEDTNPVDSKQNGIPIQDALSILGARPKCSEDHHELNHHTTDSSKEHKTSMGQTIDLFQWTHTGQDCPSLKQTVSPEDSKIGMDTLEENQKKMVAIRKEREKEVRSKLAQLSVRDLAKAVLEAQQERTATYKRFDEGLERVLKTGNMTEYPSVCAHATAAFSVLSETIHTISQIVVETYKRQDLQKMIKDLQMHEQKKLNMTAALHLEQIREKNETTNETIAQLFRESISSLKANLGELILNINDILEELRYEILDE